MARSTPESFEKRQRERRKRQKREEKLERRLIRGDDKKDAKEQGLPEETEEPRNPLDD
jgi:hypothetical protein